MAEITLTPDTVDESVAITSWDSLADGLWASSGEFDIGADDYVAGLIGGMIDTGTVITDGFINLHIAASFDGTNFTSGLDGLDAAITWGTTPSSSHTNGFNNLSLLVSLDVDALDDNQVYEWGPIEISQYYGGVMPQKFCIVIQNNVGDALGADAANKLSFIGYTQTITA